MSAYKLEDVIRMWQLEQLTTEQAIGQILQLIQERDGRLQELEGRVSALRKALHGDGERRSKSETRQREPHRSTKDASH